MTVADEIEVKFRIDEAEMAKIHFFFVNKQPLVVFHEISKQDSYYYDVQDMRIRTESSTALSRVEPKASWPVESDGVKRYITLKERWTVDGFEINRETEFDYNLDTQLLLNRLFPTMQETFCKRKTGEAHDYRGLHVEMFHIEAHEDGKDPISLGMWCEVEATIAPHSDAEAVKIAQTEIFSLLGKLGVSVDRIEKKGYRTMYQESK